MKIAKGYIPKLLFFKYPIPVWPELAAVAKAQADSLYKPWRRRIEGL
jgi:hypothetical protein